MPIRSLLASALFLCAAVVMMANEEILYQSHFDRGDLTGWIDFRGNTPPDKNMISTGDDNGIIVLKTSNHRWGGLSAKFIRPLTINSSIKSLTLKIRVKQEGPGHDMVSVALSSRDVLYFPTGQAFGFNADSGFLVTGHLYREHCTITARINGQDKKSIRLANPMLPAFFKAHKSYSDWEMIYDNEKKEILVLIDGAPRLALHEISFDGVTFQSVWLTQFETWYESVRVSCLTK